jgi:hypothetical protein
MKYVVTKASEIGSKGPGNYVLDTGKKDAKGRPLREVHLVTGEGLTEQSHKTQCDMNYILRNYEKTGLITHAKKYQGQYDDVSVQDFNEAMLIVDNATNMYQELPSSIREGFNGPVDFLNFVNNPANADKMVEMGILGGNDGKNAQGAFSGAASPNDRNANNIPDTITNVDGTSSPNPADSSS